MMLIMLFDLFFFNLINLIRVEAFIYKAIQNKKHVELINYFIKNKIDLNLLVNDIQIYNQLMIY